MIDRPVGDVLQEMGLPGLPDLTAMPPLPDMPPLPLLDLSGLLQPITNLASSFGTGVLPSAAPAPTTDGSGAPVGEAGAEPQNTAAPVDPAQLLSQVSTGIQTVMQLGTSVLQAVMSLWQGMGANAAADKSAQAGKDTAAVASQSAATSAGVVAASGTVFRGATQMSAIMAKYMASLAAAGPFIATPPGQAFVLAATTETLAEALTVVGITRAELTAHSAEMSATGQKVPVTNAPTGVDSSQIMSQLMSILPTLANAATTGVKAVSDTHTALNPPKTPEDSDEKKIGDITAGGGAPLATPAVGALGGAAGAAAAARPLAEWGGGRQVNTSLNAASAAPTSPTAPNNSTGGLRGNTMAGGPGMMPMGAAGAMGAARAGEDSSTDGLRTHLVTEQHGDEVVGEIDKAAMPVVGAGKPTADTSGDDRPDQALAL
ncbi:hypothetical protein [Nocardia sp. CC227C]|uniref:hypothetical protein n=1 Tax=Nocardia sp. CC227C TaxID=3044562 RepID=UPI00278C5D8E|nr:hypothetical protein [Nocardia sp. CC227C]